ncbi:MAG TPA: phosphoribosylaminoimidazolesuccinocarboxamide synthase [Phycisphaerales bacterium]|nr:phosphoribosylaminoimidazolesuccinocarboxamide synthase [Phycisphaerales bacterium]
MSTVPAQALTESRLALPGLRRGKVRDVYDLPPGATTPPGASRRLLIVATDRISAFDVVMPTPIPGKGRLLTELSLFWLRFIERRGLCRTHLLGADAATLAPSVFGDDVAGRDVYAGRVMIARAARVVPIECVARGYLEGSGWKEYQESGSVCGVKLPSGLRRCDRLPQPIFTPATKEQIGKHDENIPFERACEIAGRETMEFLRGATIAIYKAASEHALARGVIIADTKFEFGVVEGERTPILIDEALTPDSSRFWPADSYQPGAPQPSFDKQFLREYLETLAASGRWDKQAPGPALPPHVVAGTLAKYREALARLTRS